MNQINASMGKAMKALEMRGEMTKQIISLFLYTCNRKNIHS